MTVSRQQLRALERERIKKLEAENKAFHEKFDRLKLSQTAQVAFLEQEITKLKKDLEFANKKNDELYKIIEGKSENEKFAREKAFEDRLIEKLSCVTEEAKLKYKETILCLGDK